jgi:hypothetical protein
LSLKNVFKDVTENIAGGDPNKLHLPPDIATSDNTGRCKPISREPQKKLMKFLKEVRKLEAHKIPRVKIGGNGLSELKQCCATEVLKNNLEIEYMDERRKELDVLCRQKSLQLYHEKGNFMVDVSKYSWLLFPFTSNFVSNTQHSSFNTWPYLQDAMKVAKRRLKMDQLRYVTEMESYIPTIQCICAKRGECSSVGSKDHTTEDKYDQQINPLFDRKKILLAAKNADNVTFKSMKIKDHDNNLMGLSDVTKELQELQKKIDKLQMGLRCECTCFFCLEDRKHQGCDCSKFERREKARDIIPHYKPKKRSVCQCKEQAEKEKYENKNRSRLASCKYYLNIHILIQTIEHIYDHIYI